MSEREHLAQALEALFVDPQNLWHCPFSEAVRGLSARQAAHPPGHGMNSVWALVNHIRFSHELVSRLIEGLPADREHSEAPDDWPAIGDPADEADWQASVERALAANRRLAAQIRELPAERLQEEGSWVAAPAKLIHGLIAHNSYHVAQIVMARRLAEQWEALQWMGSQG